jgi:hypothetical protein
MKKLRIGAATRRHLGLGVAALLVVFYAAYYAQRPVYNWDMVPYIAVALIDSGQAVDTAYQAAYAAIETAVPAATVRQLKGTRNEHLIAIDPSRFVALLPFFTVKPIYPALIAVLHAGGIGLVTASVVISAVSYGLICLLLYVWLAPWMPIGIGVAAMALLSLSPFLTPIAQLSSPDALSALVVLAAMFLIIERGVFSGGAALLVVAIAVRPENILLCGIGLLYLAASRHLGVTRLLLFAVAAFALYAAISAWAGNYGWKTLFYFAMVDNTVALNGFVSPLAISDYLKIYLRQIDRLIFLTQDGVTFFLLLGLGALCLKGRHRLWSDRYSHLTILALLFMAARLFALPSDALRALLPAYLMLTVAFIQACAETVGTTTTSPAGADGIR